MSARAPERDVESAPETAGAPVAGDRRFDTVVTAVSLTCLLAVLVRLSVHAAQPLTNPDTFFHLRIGHELGGSWSLTHPGSLSRYATEPWVPTQWATELLMAKVEDWFGLPGVAWLFGLLYVVFVLVVYVLCRRSADMLVSTIVTGLCVVAAAAALSARPQVLSLVLFAVSVGLWFRAVGTGRPPWLLVPLTWGWACLHGLWSLGVLLGLVFCLGALLESRGGARRPWSLLAVPALSLGAAAVTPVGPRLLASQLAVGDRAYLVTEWQPTSFRDPSAFLVAVMAGVLILLWTRTGRVGWLRILLLLLACAWAGYAVRLLGFSAVLLAPMLGKALSDLRGGLRQTRGQVRAEKVALGVGAFVVLVATAFAAPHTARRPGNVPDGFSPRLAALPAGSGVLVEDTIGSWVEWRFPRLDPTVDGLFDSYRLGYLRRFASAQSVEAGWTSYVEETDPDVAVLLTGSPLTAAMRNRLGWRQVDHEGQWVYLVPPEGKP